MASLSNSTLKKPKRSRLPFKLNLKTREIIAAYLFLTPFLVFFAIFFVRATLSSFEMSFYDWRLLRPSRPFVGFDNYVDLLNDPIWWDAVKNTIYFTVITVLGTTTVGLLAAVAVTRPIRGQGFFRILFYVPVLLSVGVIGLVWVWLLSTQFGVINYGLSFLGIRPINWLGDPDLVLGVEPDHDLVVVRLPDADVYRRTAGHSGASL